MPYPGTGLGGFPQLGAAPTLPAGVDAVTGANDPWFTMAVQLGAEPDTVAGYEDYYAAHEAFTTGGRKAVVLANPELAAVIASGIGASQSLVNAFGVALPASQYPPLATALANMLQVNNLLAGSSQAFGIWSDLPADIAQRYVAAVNQAFPVFYAQATAFDLSTWQPAADISAAWDAALWRGALALPTDSNTPPVTLGAGVVQSDYDTNIPAGHFVVPIEMVVEGPTELPDGNFYVVYHDDPRAGTNGALRAFKWGGPRYVEAQPQNVFVRPDSCIPLVLGTGSWYWNTALTGSDPTNPCTGVPAGWSQGFGLVGPYAHQAVAQSYQLAGLSLTPVTPLILPESTTAPATQYEPAQPPVSPPLATTPVVTQDEQGNLIPATPVGPAPEPPTTVVVSKLPVNDTTAVAPASGFTVPPLVLVGAAILGVLMLSGRRR